MTGGAVDLGASTHPAMMSTATGTIAFGTTFLALAAGLAVFAASRNRGQFGATNGTPPFSPMTIPRHGFTTSSTTTSTTQPPSTTIKTTTEKPTTSTSSISTFSAMNYSPKRDIYQRTMMSRLPYRPKMPKRFRYAEAILITTTPTTTTSKSGPSARIGVYPVESIEAHESYVEEENDELADEFYRPKEFDIDDNELRRLLAYHRKRARQLASTRSPTPTVQFAFTPRRISQRRMVMPEEFVTVTPADFRTVNSNEAVRTRRMSTNNVRRRATTPYLFSGAYHRPVLPQVFADEPPPGFFSPLVPAAESRSTQSPPFLLTLLTGKENQSSSNQSTTSPVPTLQITTRQSHRRSIIPMAMAATPPLSLEFIPSGSATVLLVLMAVLVFIAVLLVVALFLQRRHLMSKISEITTAGRCNVLPVSLPGHAKTHLTAAIVDLNTSPGASSSSAAAHLNSISRPPPRPTLNSRQNVHDIVNGEEDFFYGSSPSSPSIFGQPSNFGPIVSDGDDIVNVMTTMSNEFLARMENNENNKLHFTSNSSCSMPLHHY